MDPQQNTYGSEFVVWKCAMVQIIMEEQLMEFTENAERKDHDLIMDSVHQSVPSR